jgi:hypothetical protein
VNCQLRSGQNGFFITSFHDKNFVENTFSTNIASLILFLSSSKPSNSSSTLNLRISNRELIDLEVSLMRFDGGKMLDGGGVRGKGSEGLDW